ncbi:MAG: SH3 domain-containing protein [Paracoccaceae bacterium]
MVFEGIRARLARLCDGLQTPGRAALACLVGGALLLQGCVATGPGVQANDPCSQNRQPMVEAQQRFNDTIAGNVVVGAVIGGIIGGVITGDIGGAIGGAIAGGLAGAAKGYVDAKAQQAQNRAEVVQAINQDVRSSRAYVSTIGEAVRRLNTCRANEVADLRRRIETGQISGDAARAELAVLRNRIADDRRQINLVMGDVDENNGVYADALSKTQGIDRSIVVSQTATTYQPVVRGGSQPTGGTRGRLVLGSGGETRFATASVNVRSGPGTQFSVVGGLAPGQRVGVIGGSGGWSQLDTRDGAAAFVASRFLSASRPSTGGGTVARTSPGAVAVPQVDKSRRPPPKSDVEALYLEAADIRAEDQAFEEQIGDELSALEALAA